MRHGFILLDKPRGPTSHDMVARLRRQLSETNIGHLGTLDPMAEGLMVMAVGAKALKTIELFTGLTKEYEALVRLGAESTTYDSEGAITETELKPGWTPPPDASKILEVIRAHFLGSILQVPPAYSAVNIGGERAYRKARRGQNVDIPPRTVEITKCEILDYSYPRLHLKIACSSGTYIRSLAADIGRALGCGGYLESLRRTRVGDWGVEQAPAFLSIGWTDVIPLKELLVSFPRLNLSEEQWKDIGFGRSITGVITDTRKPLVAWFAELPVALLERDTKKDGMLKPRKVF